MKKEAAKVIPFPAHIYRDRNRDAQRWLLSRIAITPLGIVPRQGWMRR